MCKNCDKKEKSGPTGIGKPTPNMAEVFGTATAEAVVGGLGILGRSTIFLARGLANGTKAAGKGIAGEYTRQQKSGFSKEEQG